MKSKYWLVLIIILGFILRLYGINWDQGFHLHPDERMLIMVTDRINFFTNLNPNFFNYGSLPIYILKGTAQLIGLANYDGMLYLGRMLSIIADCLTILFIYKISLLLFHDRIKVSKTIGLFSAFFYAVAFFPIQNSHFFVVDVFLTFFVTLLIYILLLFSKKSRIKYIFLISVIFAAMMTTKFTAIIFLPIIYLVLIIKNRFRLAKTIFVLIIFNFEFLIFNFIFMPYAFIDHQRFLSDVLAQVKMNSNPYVFPYTLQYVETLPYLYYLKNIFLWGLGPIISLLSLMGFFSLFKFSIFNSQFSIKSQFLKFKHLKFISNFKFQIIFFSFYFIYFLVIGRSAVKFMRYMLPIYPFLTIMAGYGFKNLDLKFKTLVLIIAVTWSFMFISVYSQPHTRISASKWIIKNIPKGSTLAIEHWDDQLPLTKSEDYNFVELTLYDRPDIDENKWKSIEIKLSQADYLIIASNRLYIPLQRLNDCKKYLFCYPVTAGYYKKLFNNELPFKKIAEFTVYPQLTINNWQLAIHDEIADESFTVYDHPKIMIFKKLQSFANSPM